MYHGIDNLDCTYSGMLGENLRQKVINACGGGVSFGCFSVVVFCLTSLVFVVVL